MPLSILSDEPTNNVPIQWVFKVPESYFVSLYILESLARRPAQSSSLIPLKWNSSFKQEYL
uniref:Uncharacterized protein n=1 Tax=Octopus bimaculoides TaxID=37653 RepID=A0A0L8GCB4_OCTBM